MNTANPTHSFLDAGGRTIRYADATLQPIVFAGAGGLRVNAVVLRSDGEIVTDLVREQGAHEKGVVEQGKQRVERRRPACSGCTRTCSVTTVEHRRPGDRRAGLGASRPAR